MLRALFRELVVCCATMLAIICMVSPAEATSVTPIVVDLQTSGQRMSQVVTIENKYSRPIVIELLTQEAEYVEDGIKGTGKETDDLLVFPPQVIIQPGASQAVRVQYVGDPELARSRHYFMTVAQLPVKLPEGETAVQILYNFQVVVGVSMPGGVPAIRVVKTEISTTGDGQPRVQLMLHNDADTYGYLSGGSLLIIQRDASGKEIFKRTMTGEQIAQEIGFGLVGAGKTRRIDTPIVLPDTGGVVEAKFTPSRN